MKISIFTENRSDRYFYYLTLIIAFIMLFGNAICPVEAQMLDSLDKATIDSALKLINLRPEELGFDKLYAEDDTFRLDIVERLLDHPLELPDYIDGTAAIVDSFSSNKDSKPFLDFINKQLTVDIKVKKRKPLEWTPGDFDPADPLKVWTEALKVAEPLRKEFYKDLDSLELNDLIMTAPTLWSEEEGSINAKLAGSWQFAVGIEVDTSREFDQDHLLDIIVLPLHQITYLSSRSRIDHYYSKDHQ